MRPTTLCLMLTLTPCLLLLPGCHARDDREPAPEGDADADADADTDTDADGDADTDTDACEPTPSAYPTHYQVYTQGDIDTLCASYDGVDGDLSIRGEQVPADVQIDCLVRICGSLDAIASSAHTIRLPGLQEVGEIVIERNDDLRLLELEDLERAYDEIAVWNEGDASLQIALPALERAGAVSINAIDVHELDLGSLRQVDGELDLNDIEIVSLDLGDLEHTGGLAIRHDWALLEVDLEALERIDDGFILRDCRSLEAFEIPRLEQVGGELWVFDNDPLRQLSFSALRTVGEELKIYDSEGVTEVDLGSLQTVTGDLAFINDEALTDIDVDQLEQVGGSLKIVENTVLDDVRSFHGVEQVSADLVIVDNPSLATQDAEALRDAIGEDNIGGSVQIEGND